MTHAARNNLILGWFRTNIEVPNNLVIQYPNTYFRPPHNTIFTRLEFDDVIGKQVTIGGAGSAVSNRFRNNGALIAYVHAPMGKGTAGIDTVVDLITGTSGLRARTISSGGTTVVFRTPWIENIGKELDFWRTDIYCPFYHDENSG